MADRQTQIRNLRQDLERLKHSLTILNAAHAGTKQRLQRNDLPDRERRALQASLAREQRELRNLRGQVEARARRLKQLESER